jgi:uncharacterized protein (TIGR02145 family)
MGKYKVFNGTDWVDICNCQVNIRNASNDWQLLDPKNCLTKYWTGTEWCEVTCCTCLEGYTLNASGNTCEKIERVPATASGGTFYPITPGNINVSYGDFGAALYADISGATFPLNGFDFPDYVVKDNAGTGITYPKVTSDPNNQIFNTQGTSTTKGRLNYSSIWGTGYPDDTLFTVRFCVTITEAKTYIFALAGDNQVNASITSTTFQGGVTDLNIINLWGSSSPTGSPEQASNTRPFNYWHMFPITLPVGTHTFKLSGYNFSGDVAFGAEVYNISVANMLTLIASTTATPADLEPYILFTTKELIQSPPLLLPAPGQTGITYTCPSGYTFTDCYGVPQCTIDLSYPCGGTPPDPDPCACTTGEVVIGTQTWTCTNTNIVEYSDGTVIPQVTDDATWNSLKTGAWCYYDNDPATEAIYGKLYNWFAFAGIYDTASLANPSLRKQFAPTGYHTPSLEEWTVLFNSVGGISIGAKELKQAGTTHWIAPNTGTDSKCFAAVAGGFRQYVSSPTFFLKGYSGNWWTTSEFNNDPQQAFIVRMNNTSDSLASQSDRKEAGYSVRFIKGPAPILNCTGDEVGIGVRVWKRNNLTVKTFNNGDPITEITSSAQWAAFNHANPAWAYVAFDSTKEAELGLWYNHAAIIDSRGIAPTGWHVATDQDFYAVSSYLEDIVDSGNGGGKMKDTDAAYWYAPNTGATNSSCFTGRGTTAITPSGNYQFLYAEGGFYTSTVTNTNKSVTYSLDRNSKILTRTEHLLPNYQGLGVCVRLVKDF